MARKAGQRAAGSGGEAPKRTVSGWVKAFVGFHVLAVTMWSIPRPSDAVENERVTPTISDRIRVFNNDYLLTSPLQYYDEFFGWWQYWDMFAPNPADTDIWCDAVITYQNGTQSVYQYPRMYLLSNWDKYFSERYRKFYERVNPDSGQEIWPFFAQCIALKNYHDASNPPVEVQLRRHWKQIQPPGTRQLKDYSEYTYYDYRVDLGELRADGVTP